MTDTLESALSRLTEKAKASIAPVGKSEELDRAQREAAIKEKRAWWNAPKRHLMNRDKIDRSGLWGSTEAKLIGLSGSGFLVALVGHRGPGKTQMGVELMVRRTEGLKTARYCTATEFLMHIKGTYKATEKLDEEDIIGRFVRPDLLVIDEYAKRRETDWEHLILFELLDKRYREMRDTLLIANQTKEEFIESLGPSLASRMQETGGIIECTWENYRA